MKRFAAVLVLFALVLAGCEQKKEVVEPQAETTKPINPQSEALTQAEQAGLLETPEPEGMSGEDAQALVMETLDAEQYAAELTDQQLSVGKDEKSTHDYYVFEVKDAAGAPVGQIAVDKETGDKYNYLGDGVLDEYKTFPLYDPAVDAVCDWQGAYEGPAVTLEILQGDSSSFEYQFSDGTVGNAHITGNTAKSSDETISFLFSEDIITVAGGGLTGNYTQSVE